MNTKLQSKQKEPNKQKKLDSFKGFETLNSKQLQEIDGGLNIFGIIERDGTRAKGHRWKWFWQSEW